MLAFPQLDLPVTVGLRASDVEQAIAIRDDVTFLADNGDVTTPAAYDQVTKTLTTASQPRGPFGIAATSIDNLAFYAGGFDGGNNVELGTDRVDIYNADTNTWSVAHLSQARGNITTALVFGKVLFAGGAQAEGPGGPGNISNAMDIYDTATHTWTSTTMPIASFETRFAVAFDKYFYVPDNQTIERFDVTTNQWSSHPLSQSRYNVTPVSIGENALFVGGIFYDRRGVAHNSNVVDVYNDLTQSWTTTSLPFATDVISTTVVGNVAVLALGGGRVAIYDAGTGEWTTQKLSAGNVGDSAVTLGNLVLFFGQNSVDSYDVNTGDWKSVSSLVGAITQNEYVALPRGLEVFFFPTLLGGIEIYDPSSNDWASAIPGTGVEYSAETSNGNQIFALGAYRLRNHEVGPVKLDIFSPTNLTTPTPITPVDTSTSANTYVFRWAPVAGATGYDLYLDHRRIAANVDATRFVLPNGLAGGTHTWEVAAITPDGRMSGQPATFTAQVPRVVATYKSDDLPATLPEHTRGTVHVKITNIGDATLAAPFRISILASATSSIDSHFFLVNGGSVIRNHPLRPGDSLELRIPVFFNFKEDPDANPVTLLVTVDRAAGGRHGSHRQFLAVLKGPSLPV